ncbi:MAG: hypothetical protein NZU63_00565 [Gemmataceae bacterium]|nr:hypothetical protein [Gemmataceae bacterium]MDW8242241.1 hypothetical protein [Thermogemmata sp.]
MFTLGLGLGILTKLAAGFVGHLEQINIAGESSVDDPLQKTHPPEHKHENSRLILSGLDSASSSPDTLAPARDLESIDVLLALGEYEYALRECEKYGNTNKEHLWRKGLALEGLERWEDALLTYGQIAQDAGERSDHARLGQARCFLALGKDRDAQRLRAEVLLQSGDSDQRLVQECLILHAQEVYRRENRSLSPDPLNARQLAWPATRPRHEQLCEWLLRGNSRNNSPSLLGLPEGVIQWLWIEGEGRVEPAVTIQWPRATVAEHLYRLCAALGWELRVEDAASQQRLFVAQTAVKVVGVPVEEVLEALCTFADTAGERQGWSWVIGPRGSRASVDVYRRAWHWCAEHPWSPSIQLILANHWQQHHTAEDWVRRLYRQVSESTNSVERLAALYNWGLWERQQGRLAAAGARLYDLLDSVPEGPWVARAHWWLGRIALDSGDLTNAERHWQALITHQVAEWSAAARLGLLFLALLREQDAHIHQMLNQWRLPSQAPYAAWSDLLEAWVHYRHHPTPSRAEAVARALQRLDNCSLFDAAGHYWAGQVWYQLNNPEQMIRCYQQAEATGRNPWTLQMLNALASYYHQVGLVSQARSHDWTLLAVDPKGWGQWAAIRLAASSLEHGEVHLCVDLAWRLRHAPEQLQREALPLLGAAYERLGRFRWAAECFAGRWPDEAQAHVHADLPAR